jgi:hypothetical protein
MIFAQVPQQQNQYNKLIAFANSKLSEIVEMPIEADVPFTC